MPGPSGELFNSTLVVTLSGAMDRFIHFTNDDLGLSRTPTSYVLRSTNEIMGNSLVCLLYGLVKSAHGDG